MKIVLLGAGNVATHLGSALIKSGHEVAQVWSRTEHHTQELADALNAKAIDNLGLIATDADLYIIAVKDDAIANVAAQLHLKDQLLVHTSGAVPLDILKGTSSQIGVFYPLQTFSKVKQVNFKEIPVCIEANTDQAYQLIETVAAKLSNKVYKVDTEQRSTLHVAAVFACNFTNYLYAVAHQLLEDKGMSFDLIRPLIAETADKVLLNLPETVQTGPAIRHDQSTMQKHLEMLKNKPELSALYQLLSERIEKM